jgi:hypothetical protein
LADVRDTGLVMLGGWMALLVGVSVLRDASPLRRPLRATGAGLIALGLSLAVYARAAL